jgi:dihydroflavonol-4-reductase
MSSNYFQSKAVAVTGANGFIGSNIVKKLVENNANVCAIVEPNSNCENLSDLNVEIVSADIRNTDEINKALKDAEIVFHTAALYSFWHNNPEIFYDINVKGTINVLKAAKEHKVKKIVYTSTVATFGIDQASKENPSNEDCFANIDHLFGHYKKSKYVAEHEVLRSAAQGQNITLVHPTTPVGYGDFRPTPTGQFILDFLNGRMPGYVETILNIVNVSDVATGHLLAAQKGKPGKSYILGGENLYMKEILAILSDITGLKCPSFRVPPVITYAVGILSTKVEPLLLKRQPSVPYEAVRMSATKMAFSSDRACKELGYSPQSSTKALYEAVSYFLATDKVKPEQKKLILDSTKKYSTRF